MFVDSHCHLHLPELRDRITEIIAAMQQNQVTHALSVSVELSNLSDILALIAPYPQLFASVGVHPSYTQEALSLAQLITLAEHEKVVALGETGLDYHYQETEKETQQTQFRTHIQAGHITKKPLIIHTRAAAEDTLQIMREEGADQVGGVLHCFTESLAMAKAALDLGFYISFSGIITFKNAIDLRDIVRYIPLDRLLIETDSPYLAPVPFRGKTNQPAFVTYVAQCIAEIHHLPVDKIAEITTQNFFHLFTQAKKALWRS